MNPRGIAGKKQKKRSAEEEHLVIEKQTLVLEVMCESHRNLRIMHKNPVYYDRSLYFNS